MSEPKINVTYGATCVATIKTTHLRMGPKWPVHAHVNSDVSYAKVEKVFESGGDEAVIAQALAEVCKTKPLPELSGKSKVLRIGVADLFAKKFEISKN